MAPIRVFVLDDHEIVRRGLRELLQSEPDLEVVGEAGTAAQALTQIASLLPDVAIVDARLPDGSGVEVCRSIRSAHPSVQVLILTSFDDDEALYSAILGGAGGYVLKQVQGEALIHNVRRVAQGYSVLDPALVERVAARMRSRPANDQDPLAGLNEQERKILDLIAEGLSNRQIGERLFLAEKTIKNYVSAILAKLGLERRTQAAMLVARRTSRDSSR
ncbi:response regulator [Nocardioides massiliensis]|uniref:Two-component system response regulator DevR n=1 Tax=Nocardioides massiliensis TaxID=1325935 RepID=A0ABT9NK77_9ACTN|nr:response regulator transcription factor [Nocardioides massiliensis]MDP9820622.1 two-component system response regulator DevR [Nocardioides massiliensis]